MPLYSVRTERFGSVLLMCEDIGQARKWARDRFGAGPECVSRAPTDRPLCPACDSRPCCCPDGGRPRHRNELPPGEEE
jgi:hypothetical protein